MGGASAGGILRGGDVTSLYHLSHIIKADYIELAQQRISECITLKEQTDTVEIEENGQPTA